MAYLHGIDNKEAADTSSAIQTISTSDIGMVVTAPDADATVFPLNTPVMLTGDITGAIAKAGATGTAAGSLQAIADQVVTPIVVVRVAPGANAAETTANIIGGEVNGKKTGMQALLAAQAQGLRRPRILGVPGLDTQPVAAALAVVAKKLRAMAYCGVHADTIAQAVTYRGQFSARELMLLYPDFIATGPDGNPVTSYAVARALGLRAQIDKTVGWHKTISNVAVDGVIGVTKDILFDIQDMSTDAGILNAAQITTMFADDGYRFWGNSTCSDDANFRFESAVRTAQVLKETIALGLKRGMDAPMTPGIVKDRIEKINGLFQREIRAGRLIGAKCWYDAELNSNELLAQGQTAIRFNYTPVPPLEGMHITQSITDVYFARFAELVTGSDPA